VRALKYFFVEAGASLWRRRGASLVSVLTIGAGLFVLGFFLVLNDNLQRVVSRWTESAELSVYLDDAVTLEQVKAVEDLIAQSGLSTSREHLSKEQAARRFRDDFPDLAASTSRLESNPFPASIEVRLSPDVSDDGAGLDVLADRLAQAAGVADVRYDRRWLSRLNAVVRLARGVAILVIVLLVVASALTVANVIRLAAAARRDEIHIMQLVGAPFAYVRGPFVVEGILQGGAGALLALVVLVGVLAAARARYGQLAADVFGGATLTLLPLQFWLIIVAGGMLLGSVGGYIVARGVR
jgi:cell division transport system permease protein